MTTTTDPKAELLRAVPGLAASADRELGPLLALVDEVTFVPGTTLVREGCHATQVFVIVDGTAEVVAAGRTRATLRRGDYVGEIAALNHGVHTATVVARSPVRALVMDPRGFLTMLGRPRVAAKLAAQLAYRMRA